MKHHRTLFVVAFLAVVALLSGACGGSNDDGSTMAPAGSAASTDGGADAGVGIEEAGTIEPTIPPDASASSGDTSVAEDSVVTDGISDRAPLTIEEAIVELGPLAQPWPGPIFTEYVCTNLPHDHIEAVVGVIPAGERFEYGPDGSCRLSTGEFALRIDALGTQDHRQTFEVRKELLSGDQPIAGFGDEAVELAEEGRQTVLILDGDIVWQLEGDRPDTVPREQFHAFATVLLTRFDPVTRVDAAAEPLGDDELAQLAALLEDWYRTEDAFMSDAATEEDLQQYATPQAATAVLTSRTSNQRRLDEGIGGNTYQIQQLEQFEAAWFRGTSRGDTILVDTCVNSERGRPEGLDPLTSSVVRTLRIVTDGDVWLVDGPVEGSGLTASTSCS